MVLLCTISIGKWCMYCMFLTTPHSWTSLLDCLYPTPLVGFTTVACGVISCHQAIWVICLCLNYRHIQGVYNITKNYRKHRSDIQRKVGKHGWRKKRYLDVLFSYGVSYFVPTFLRFPIVWQLFPVFFLRFQMFLQMLIWQPPFVSGFFLFVELWKNAKTFNISGGDRARIGVHCIWQLETLIAFFFRDLPEAFAIHHVSKCQMQWILNYTIPMLFLIFSRLMKT